MDEQSLLSQAIQLHQQGAFSQADGLYEILLQKNNEHPELLYLSSSTSWILGRPEAAYARLKKAIHLQKDDRFFALMGNVCQSLGEYEESVTHYQLALKHGNTEADTHTNMGVTLHELHRYKESEQAHQNALAIEESHLGARYNLARVYLEQKDHSQAQKHFLLALEEAPEDVDILNNLGNTYLHQEEIQLARQQYAKALGVDQHCAEALYNMAMSYQKTGDTQAAKHRLQALLGIHPKHFSAMIALADICIFEHDYYTAEQLLGMATQLQPHHHLAWSSFADVLMQQDQYSAAIVAIEKTLSLKETAKSWIQLAVVQREMRNQKQLDISNNDIADSFRRALALEPNNGKAQYLLDMMEGTTPTRAPCDYVENLFDFYAPKFEEHLVDILEYQTPRCLQEMLLSEQEKKQFESILDIGCGTGLMGERLCAHTNHLIGVDISTKMLSIAKKKQCYQELLTADIFQFLADSTHAFDLIVASDVLVYIGDLQPIFASVCSRLTDNGYFLFSVEELFSDEGIRLNAEARFQHSFSHIQQSLPPSLSIHSMRRMPLRKNSDVWVEGLLVLAQKQSP